MADEKIVIEISGNIKADIAARIRDIAKAALEAKGDLALLKSELKSFSPSSALKAAASDTARFRSELTKTSTTVRKYTQDLKMADSAQAKMASSSSRLGGSLQSLVGLFASIFAVQQYAQAQDALTSIQNQIRSITQGAGEAARLQQTLFDLATRTRSGIESTTAAYVNFYKNLSVIGASEQEVLRIVETLNKGFIVGGKSAAEAAGSVRQFIQGLQNGALRGEEFNSVMEAFPVEIIREFAKVLGVSQQELRKAAEEGRITADVIRQAMSNAAGSVDRLFANTVPTIGNALTELNNRFILFTQSSVGGATMLANAILFVADNLDILIPVLGTLAGAVALVKFAQLITDLFLLGAAMAPVVATVGAFALGMAGGAAAAYLLAEIIARVTGRTEDLTHWVQETAAGFNNLVTSVGAFAQSKLGIDTVNAALAESNAQMAGLLNGTSQTSQAIQTFAGGAAGIYTVGGAVQAVNDNLSQTAPAATRAAGAVASISGEYNGVINVAEALRQTSGAAGSLAQNAGFAVTQLKSVSGQYNGVMQIASALNAVASAAASAAANVRQLASEQAAASGRNRDRTVPNGGDSAGSFTNITGNTSGNSFVNVPAPSYAQGGRFVVKGKQGVDQNLVRFNASRGEEVQIKTKAQQRNGGGGMVDNSRRVQVTIVANDVNSFNSSRQQVQDFFNSAVNAG